MRRLVPGPYKIWPANPVLSRTIVPTGAYYQAESSLTKGEIEIVTNVINGHWGAAYGNYEHEKTGIEQGHLAPEQVAVLIAGLPASFDDARQQVVYELTRALAAGRVVPLGLFRRAQDLIGDKGIVDVTALMGWFTTVSGSRKQERAVAPGHRGGLVDEVLDEPSQVLMHAVHVLDEELDDHGVVVGWARGLRHCQQKLLASNTGAAALRSTVAGLDSSPIAAMNSPLTGINSPLAGIGRRVPVPLMSARC